MTTNARLSLSSHQEKDREPPPGASRERNKQQTKRKSGQTPIFRPSDTNWGPGDLLASLWRTEISIWQHAGRPVADSLVAVTQCPERDILLVAGTKVAGPQGLPISILVCVFNTGLNGKDKSQHPGLFLSREVLLFQLLMPL